MAEFCGLKWRWFQQPFVDGNMDVHLPHSPPRVVRHVPLHSNLFLSFFVPTPSVVPDTPKMSSTKAFLVIGSTLVVPGMPGDAFVFSAPARTSTNSPSAPRTGRSCQLSSKPSFSPPGSARFLYAPLCSVSQPGTSETIDDERTAFVKEIEERQNLAARVADKYSRDYANFYVVPGRITENAEFYRLFTYLLWKVDVLVDDFPQWKTFLDPEASKCRFCSVHIFMSKQIILLSSKEGFGCFRYRVSNSTELKSQ